MNKSLLYFVLGAIGCLTASALPDTLNVTAIAVQNNVSVLECWALNPGFVTSAGAGTAGAANLNLAPLAPNATYTVIPAAFNGGPHNAPYTQFVVFLSGLAHITLPNATGEAWVSGGKYGLIYASDIADVSDGGHITVYPSDEITVALQIPTSGIPEHIVVHDGPCRQNESQLSTN